MCLIFSLGCCGCSSPKPCHKNSKKQQQKQQQQQQEQHLQHQPKNYHSDIQLNELSPELSSINCQVTTSQPSLSPSLTALPHRIATSSTLSSWAGEEELCDMEDYDSRTPTRWTAWWLKGAAVEGDKKGCHSTSIVS